MCIADKHLQVPTAIGLQPSNPAHLLDMDLTIRVIPVRGYAPR